MASTTKFHQAPKGVIDPNGKAGGDNYGSETVRRFTIPDQAGVSNLQTHVGTTNNQLDASCTVTMPASGIIEIEFSTTAQPGDNFRAVLGFNPADLDVVQVVDPAAIGYLDSGSAAIIGSTKCAASDMLTVWRQLSVEMDSMPMSPTSQPSPDKVSFTQATWGGNAEPSIVYFNGFSFSSKVKFYEGGLIRLENNVNLEIVSSAPNHLFPTGLMAVLDHNLNAAEVAALATGGVVTDDDGRFFPASMGPMLPRYDMLTDPLVKDLIIARYITAYILIQPVQGFNAQKIVEWAQYHGPESSFNKYVAARDVAGSESFWAAQLSAGYQPTADSNGPEEGPYIGATWFENKSSVVFIEECRDFFQDLLKSPDPVKRSEGETSLRKLIGGVAAHELAHLPLQATVELRKDIEADHKEGGLMGDGATDLGIGFNAKTHRRMRRVYEWEGFQP